MHFVRATFCLYLVLSVDFGYMYVFVSVNLQDESCALLQIIDFIEYIAL